MTYAELVAKLKSGQPLTAEEFIEFEQLSRPTERFNQVSDKARQFEAALKEKDAEILKLQAGATEAAQKVTDEVNLQMRELAGKVETLTGENTTLKQKQQRAERMDAVRNYALKNSTGLTVKNPAYLNAILEERGIDISKKDDVEAVLKELREQEPEIFVTSVKSGAGVGATPPGGDNGTVIPDKHPSTWTPQQVSDFVTKEGYDKFAALASQPIPDKQ